MVRTLGKVNISKLSSTLIDLVKPTIKEYYISKSKRLMDEWQGNCCAQTAVVVANIMSSSIDKLGYITKAYHGEFVDIINGNQVEYNHCWVYCESKHDRSESIFIDVGRTSKQCIVMHRALNSYDKRIPGYEYQYIKSFQEIDHKASLNEIDYFIEQKASVSYKAILNLITNQKIFK